jgi:hypothetical protein
LTKQARPNCFYCGARKRVIEVVAQRGTAHIRACISCDVDLLAREVSAYA